LRLSEADFRGERFRDHARDLKGDNDLLCLTRPDLVRGIHDAYLEAGFPIATGVIEGACRHLIRDRLAMTGARWSLAGAEAILRLRSLRASGDWDAYWRHHEQKEHERNHAARYANAAIPHLTPPESPSRRKGKTFHLRVVK